MERQKNIDRRQGGISRDLAPCRKICTVRVKYEAYTGDIFYGTSHILWRLRKLWPVYISSRKWQRCIKIWDVVFSAGKNMDRWRVRFFMTRALWHAGGTPGEIMMRWSHEKNMVGRFPGGAEKICTVIIFSGNGQRCIKSDGRCIFWPRKYGAYTYHIFYDAYTHDKNYEIREILV